jgi:hypothetical protein
MYIAHLSTAITLNQTVLNSMVFQKKNGHRVVALCPEDEWTEAIKAHDIEVIEVPFHRHSLIHSFTRHLGFLVAAGRSLMLCIHIAERWTGSAAAVFRWCTHLHSFLTNHGKAFTLAYEVVCFILRMSSYSKMR